VFPPHIDPLVPELHTMGLTTAALRAKPILALRVTTIRVKKIFISLDSNAEIQSFLAEPANPSVANKLTVGCQKSPTHGSENLEKLAHELDTLVGIACSCLRHDDPKQRNGTAISDDGEHEQIIVVLFVKTRRGLFLSCLPTLHQRPDLPARPTASTEVDGKRSFTHLLKTAPKGLPVLPELSRRFRELPSSL
jgi:hypothetical protein